MKCPTCAVDLVMSERQGIEIDYCPTCRGVWLDRGELDKIIERSQALQPVRAEVPAGARPAEALREPYRGDRDRHDDDHHHGYHGKHRRKSFLAELFD